MKLRINDEPFEIHEGADLASLIEQLGLSGERGVAVAIRDEVIPKAQWGQKRLCEGDSLLIIRASQGG